MRKPGTAKATGAPREILAGLVDIIKQQQKMIDNLAERLRQIEATNYSYKGRGKQNETN